MLPDCSAARRFASSAPTVDACARRSRLRRRRARGTRPTRVPRGQELGARQRHGRLHGVVPALRRPPLDDARGVRPERAVPPVEPVAERAARAQAPDRRDVPVPVGVRQRPQRRRRPRAAPLQEPVELRPRPDDVLDVRGRRREPHGLADARDRPLDHALERRVPVLAPRRHARAPVPAPLDGVPAAVAHVRRQRPLQRVPQVRGVLAQPLDCHGPRLQEPREPRVGAGLGVAPPRLRRVAAPERDVLRHVDLEPVGARGEEGREVLACGGRARVSSLAPRATRDGDAARAPDVRSARRAAPCRRNSAASAARRTPPAASRASADASARVRRWSGRRAWRSASSLSAAASSTRRCSAS